jgi:hypothetical protein
MTRLPPGHRLAVQDSCWTGTGQKSAKGEGMECWAPYSASLLSEWPFLGDTVGCFCQVTLSGFFWETSFSPALGPALCKQAAQRSFFFFFFFLSELIIVPLALPCDTWRHTEEQDSQGWSSFLSRPIQQGGEGTCSTLGVAGGWALCWMAEYVSCLACLIISDRNQSDVLK